jgi:hypothetical protein
VNWFLVLMAFSLAVFMGAAAASLLARVRPQWTERRRLFLSALVLPVLTLVAFLAVMVAVVIRDPGHSRNMQDLALAAVASLGGLFALLAFVGGLIGAWLRQRGKRR